MPRELGGHRSRVPPGQLQQPLSHMPHAPGAALGMGGGAAALCAPQQGWVSSVPSQGEWESLDLLPGGLSPRFLTSVATRQWYHAGEIARVDRAGVTEALKVAMSVAWGGPCGLDLAPLNDKDTRCF